MADGPSFQVDVGGLPALRRDLRAVDKKLPSQVLPAAGRRAAELVKPYAQQEAPVGATGKLRSSVRVLASQKRAAIAAGSDRGHGPAWYARPIHRGTARRRNRRGANRGRVAGNPFLYRAIDRVGDRRIVDVYESELDQLLAAHGLRL